MARVAVPERVATLRSSQRGRLWRATQRGLLRGALCIMPALWCASARASSQFLGGGVRWTTSTFQPSDASGARIGPGFVYLPAASGLVACGLRSMANDALTTQVTEAERELGLDVQLAVVLVTHPIGCDNLFYVPVANEIRGIGYATTNGVELFDEDPETQLEGIAFLNDWPYWEAEYDEFRTAFLHEVGHRWGARVSARRDGVDYTLTGREGGHWSYFLDSGGSPLEGNRFELDAPMQTATPALRLQYSPLDLYLMGVTAPETVGAIRLLVDGSAERRDCAGHVVTQSSPPQTCAPNSLDGHWMELRIEDVIAKEGPRVPASVQTSGELNVGIFVSGSQSESWSVGSCERLTSAIDEALYDFARATGERLRLKNAIDVGLSCSDLLLDNTATEAAPEGAACALCRASSRTRASLSVYVFGLIGLIRVLRKLARQ